MTRLVRCYWPPFFAGCAVAFAVALLVYGSFGHGWVDTAHQTLPGGVAACALGVVFGLIALVASVFVAVEFDRSQARERYLRTGPLRVEAQHRADRVRIVRYGGGDYERTLGDYSVEDAEAAMDCMARARAALKPELDAHREAARLARLLNR